MKKLINRIMMWASIALLISACSKESSRSYPARTDAELIQGKWLCVGEMKKTHPTCQFTENKMVLEFHTGDQIDVSFYELYELGDKKWIRLKKDKPGRVRDWVEYSYILTNDSFQLIHSDGAVDMEFTR